ncbi:MAG: SOS response-associated peptidase [Pseudomonadota bacterium]|nr:SOS response-associated peptidase [Pseudomonadota bacterium]
MPVRDIKMGHKMVNARAETVAARPTFRAAYKARRCLIPTNGFYAWTRDVELRQRQYIYTRDGSPMRACGKHGRARIR